MYILLTDTRNGFKKRIDIDADELSIWQKGNLSCDCNRVMVLYGGKEENRFDLEWLREIYKLDCNKGKNVINMEVDNRGL